MQALFTKGPYFLIFLFSFPLHFFGAFFLSKIGIYDLDFAYGTLFWAFTQWKGGV
jgi:hypothetical protein